MLIFLFHKLTMAIPHWRPRSIVPDKKKGAEPGLSGLGLGALGLGNGSLSAVPWSKSLGLVMSDAASWTLG